MVVVKKLNKSILAMFLIFLMFLSLVLLPVIADKTVKNFNENVPRITNVIMNDDDDDDEVEREVEVIVSDDSVDITSTRDTEDTEDSIEFAIETSSSGLSIELEYESESSTTEIDLSFEVIIGAIVEYIDEDEDGVYDETVDTEVQQYEFEDFETISYTIDNITGVPLYTIFIATLDGIFTATIYFSTTFVDVNGTIVAPTQLKIDFGIHNFSYIEDDSLLALAIEIKSEADYEVDDETEDEKDGRAENESEITFNSNDFVGFFSWVEVAMVDGIEQQVKTILVEEDIDEGSAEVKLYLCYTRGTEIIHDPKVGVANVLYPPSDDNDDDDGDGDGDTNGDTNGENPFDLSDRLTFPPLSRNSLLLVMLITILITLGLVIYNKKRMA